MADARNARGDTVVAVSDLVEEIFLALRPMPAAVANMLESASGVGARALDALAPLACSTLGGLIVGAGFVAAPGVLVDRQFELAWWKRFDGTPNRLIADLDPTSEKFFDYTRMPWFTVPRDTGQRQITGPYVDFLCTDDYTLTFTLPVRRGGAFAGVVGADVQVRDVERVVMPHLRGLGGRAALINNQGRVIVSTNARQATGSLVRNPDIPGWWAAGAQPATGDGTSLRRCGDTQIALLVT
ncbi:cache domain-containing protein [Nocardia sp. NBC_00565]|uniref:PDC sensor domain-containing protein n=1 Tax=Nocardia sp. NBC_00565 TaxID=2975993 RepID=UPI002E8125C3|nr:cache domain-containing protein [Nocardia sp. NBC_00565]WUC07556.1 cache domain-containing protein [Nocardia sp. NBC_00565]